ncbi:hypothetical protein GCM10023264_25790 [Sphingomonas daechungensis]|uniref:Glyoxalase n=1 Tax=Sphingomonas daechungensis TaxID=1176646 RepID=A0ABX6T0V8_9SPHN|nr:hypothetical protein [Sphingomonas daechungensis]QNP43472.1 hypothetical protein H9L15_01290 [Sphingomonas daechungensis]
MIRISEMRDLGTVEAFVLAADVDRASEIFEHYLWVVGGDPDTIMLRELELQQLNEPANDAVYEALEFGCEGLVLRDPDGEWGFVSAEGPSG